MSASQSPAARPDLWLLKLPVLEALAGGVRTTPQLLELLRAESHPALTRSSLHRSLRALEARDGLVAPLEQASDLSASAPLEWSLTPAGFELLAGLSPASA